ncbi:MAG: hypothetical protein NXI04_05750 [Planctomycetaceae bacterium]|nr:hypothetical protein [Planctomycetaceae bacterium]
MSDAPFFPSETPGGGSVPVESQSTEPPRRSFLESFISSFFHDQNIKWMLIVGAAIVFGSSLMLVTKNWAMWGNTLKYCSIFGYTVALFTAAEVSRKRLGLTSTYKVLHSLTLLLMPILFLALRWLSAGTAAQVWDAVELAGLMLPAVGFLWLASTRILDHQLRERQTTFVVSFCALCLAGALPPFQTPLFAFAFLLICWTVMTVGVMKVNRHVFWLTEEHRLPRIFGFVPIAMLGLLFCVLIGTKALPAIPMQWLGLGVVMLAATILLTARTVASVFRQRTGDLVRPLPWCIGVPLFVSLVLTVVAVTLSFSGFSYTGPTTYAVIPTAAVAAVLMFVAAADTRHTGFVWVGLIFSVIAYQTCPVLFADVVQMLKSNTAAAINRDRVPLSLYGVTYLPLLGTLALISRRFRERHLQAVQRSIKQFVTILAVVLLAFSATDIVSLFWVAAANSAAFVLYAVAFRDRRYALVSLLSVIVMTAVAVPALNDMAVCHLPVVWAATALAGLSLLMTSVRLPDRLLGRIPLESRSLLVHRSEDGQLNEYSWLLQKPTGENREIIRYVGLVLAVLLAGHWVVMALLQMHQPLATAAMWQYGLLMTAFVGYTARSPGYFSGLFFWGMAAFATVRWAVGLQVDGRTIVDAASIAAAGISLMCYLLLILTRQLSWSVPLNELRNRLGFDATQLRLTDHHPAESENGWTRLLQASVVPLCDLSLVVLACLAAPFHLLQVMSIHGDALAGDSVAGQLSLATTVIAGWLAAATMVFRSRVTAIAMAVVLPLVTSAALLSSGLPLPPAWWSVVWVIVESGLLILVAGRTTEKTGGVRPAVGRVAEVWLMGLLLFSCLFFQLPARAAAMLCLLTFFIVDRRRWTPSQRTFQAICANLQLLLLAGWMGGFRGLISSALNNPVGYEALPWLLGGIAVSISLFDIRWKSLDQITSDTWTGVLRAAAAALICLLFAMGPVTGISLVVVVSSLAALAVGELIQAIRRSREAHVWCGYTVIAACVAFLMAQGVLSFGTGLGQFVILGTAILALTLAGSAQRYPRFAVLGKPSQTVGRVLPGITAGIGVLRFLDAGAFVSPAINSLSMMLASGIYAYQAILHRSRGFALLSGVIMNTGLMLLWRSFDLHALELYLVPVGVSILLFVEILKRELPRVSHDPLRYIGALTILVSPLFEVLDGSWTHMLILMVLSTLLVLLAMGLRIRVLMYAGSAFLFADLLAMVVRSTIDHPSLLWAFGIAFGIGVIALAAFCENHREKLLARIRLISAELATWQ